MRNKKEIEDCLTELYVKRLSLRFKKYLHRSHFNCIYNERCSLTNGLSGHKVGCCRNSKISQNDKIFICNDEQQAVKCKYYICSNSKEDIERQFKKDISDPKICGQKEPKIAVLLWVLYDSEKIPIKIEKKGWFTNLCKKLLFWKANGLA